MMYQMICVSLIGFLLQTLVLGGSFENTGFCQERLAADACHGHPPFPTFKDSDNVDIYYMEAPVFELEFGNELGDLHLYHGAVGFMDTTNNQNYSVEFDAFYEVANATFPWIVEPEDGNGDTDLIWCNKGVICWNNNINFTYYDPILYPSAQVTKVGSANGTTMNKFVDWIPHANNTYMDYQTFRLQSAPGNSTPFFDSQTCVDFVWEAFQRLSDLGAEFNRTVQPKRDNINLYTQNMPLSPVNHSDPVVWNDIVEFYRNFQFNSSGSTLDIVVQLLERLPGLIFDHHYLYINQSYYQVDLSYPYLGIEYDVTELP